MAAIQRTVIFSVRLKKEGPCATCRRPSLATGLAGAAALLADLVLVGLMSLSTGSVLPELSFPLALRLFELGLVNSGASSFFSIAGATSSSKVFSCFKKPVAPNNFLTSTSRPRMRACASNTSPSSRVGFSKGQRKSRCPKFSSERSCCLLPL